MVGVLKTILESDYNPSLGTLIDVRDPVSFSNHHNPNSINIHYDKLLLNHNILLDKGKKYYLICDKGHKSKKAARILSFYGYDVTVVINS